MGGPLKFALLSLLFCLSAQAGLPPTTSKDSADTRNITTFNYQFPNFTGTHTGITFSLGVNSIAGGGTGQTTASGAINALLPNQSGNSGLFLSTNGSAAAWLAESTNTVYVDFVTGNDTTGVGSIIKPFQTIQKAETSITTATTTNPFKIKVSSGVNFAGVNNDPDTGTITAKPNISIVADYPTNISQDVTISGGTGNASVTFVNLNFQGPSSNGNLTWTRSDTTNMRMYLLNCQVDGTITYKQSGAGQAFLLSNDSVFSNGDLILAQTGGFFTGSQILGAFDFGDTPFTSYLILGGYIGGQLTFRDSVFVYLSGLMIDTPLGASITGVTAGGGTPSLQFDSSSVPPTLTGSFNPNTLTSFSQWVSYTPATPANWTVPPANVKDALDSLAASGILTGILPIARGGTNSGTALNNNRVMKSSGGAIVEAAAITAARALISDANGIPTQSVTTSTELGFVSGVTSAIQTQLNAKVGTIGSFNNTATANGLDISGSTLTLHAADASNPGAVSTGTQTLAGNKTFSGTVAISPSSTTALTLNTSAFIFDSTNQALGIGVQPSTAAFLDGVNSTGAAKRIILTGYGTGSTVGTRDRFARGTSGSPTAAQTGDILGFISGQGYGASTFPSTSTGALSFIAGENFTNTSNLTYATIQVAPTASTTAAEALRVASTGDTIGPQSSSTAIHQINGGIKMTTITKSANYTVDTSTTDYLIYADTSGGSFTITLPTPTNGRVIIIKDAAQIFQTNPLTLAQHSAEKIENLAASKVLRTNGGSWEISSNGTDWFVNSSYAHRVIQTFSASGSWVDPPGIIEATVYLRPGSGGGGAGGGGGGGFGNVTGGGGGGGKGGGGGGGAQLLTAHLTNLVPGTSYTVTVGAAGNGGTGGTAGSGSSTTATAGQAGTAATSGGVSSFGSLITAGRGATGTIVGGVSGGNGGGGGAGAAAAGGTATSSGGGLGSGYPETIGVTDGGAASGSVAGAATGNTTSSSAGASTQDNAYGGGTTAGGASAGGSTGNGTSGAGGSGSGGAAGGQGFGLFLTAPAPSGGTGGKGGAGGTGQTGVGVGGTNGVNGVTGTNGRGGGGGGGAGGGGGGTTNGGNGGVGGNGGSGSTGIVIVEWVE